MRILLVYHGVLDRSDIIPQVMTYHGSVLSVWPVQTARGRGPCRFGKINDKYTLFDVCNGTLTTSPIS